MVKSIHIQNFKSIVDLSIDLGTFNVLIGENGCGKSNILESIAFGAAASANKLDFEFLGSRGIRVTNPEFMFSAFNDIDKKKSIQLTIKVGNKRYGYDIVNNTTNPKKWIDRKRAFFEKEVIDLISGDLSSILNIKNDNVIDFKKNYDSDKKFRSIMHEIIPTILEKEFSNTEIANYIVYSPEQTSLRKFEETAQIYPLGIKGEGLFQYLKEIGGTKEGKDLIKKIKENLELLDWYEGFEMPENLLSNEFSLKIKDKYINKDLHFFDQRSTNEGFLYLLFYSTLFISNETPTFFAIDNIDNSFNPKLCVELIKNLATLAKKHKKQVIVTTHNPAVLDGLNLKDNNQRLFVVRRNDDGHTKAKRIEFKEERTKKMSEIWTSGIIGGLPDNF